MLAQPRSLIPFAFERRRNWKYLLDVAFASNASAPLSGYDGEVGSLVFTDSTGIYSAGSGLLTPSGLSIVGTEPLVRSVQAWTVVGGLTLAQRFRLDSALGATTGAHRIGFAAASGLPALADIAGIRPNPGSLLFSAQDTAAVNTPEIFAFDTFYNVAVVLRPSGGSLAFVDDKLVWVGVNPVFAQLVYAHSAAAASNTTPPTYEYWRVIRLDAPFDTDYGIALLHTASVNGSDYTATANLICDLIVTAPASLAGTAGLRFRKSGNDYWQVNFDNLGRLRLQRFAGGVAQGSAVNLANSVITGSVAVTLRVIASGSAMDFYTLSGTTWTKRGSQQTDGVLNANTGVMPFADSSWTSGGGSVGQLDAYARSDGSYSVVDGA